jgi:hypothetical protein
MLGDPKRWQQGSTPVAAWISGHNLLKLFLVFFREN